MSAPGTALVTGASRGIGLAIAERLATGGWGVVLTARSQDVLAQAAERITAKGGNAVTVAADLRDPAAPEAILRQAQERLGPVDLVVNNAGTAPSSKIEHTDDATLAEVLDLHIAAPFRLVRAAIPSMKERKKGCVIQIASTAGLRGFALITAYTAAKHAMVGLTRALAVELARTPIRCYAVCPGFVDTEITRQGAAKVASMGNRSAQEVMDMYGAMNASGRLLQPEEVSAVVAELASTDCSVPSGSVCDMDDMPPTYRQAN